MARTIISPYEQNLIQEIKGSSKGCLAEGVALDSNADGTGDTNILTGLLPVPQFDRAFPAGSDMLAKLEEGLEQAALPIIKHIAPIGWSEGVTPTGSFSASNQSILELVVPVEERPSVDRRMLITADITCYTVTPNNLCRFFVQYGNLVTAERQFFFNEADTHRHFSASWVVEVPARTASFRLAVRTTTPITFDFNDFYSLAVWG